MLDRDEDFEMLIKEIGDEALTELIEDNRGLQY